MESPPTVVGWKSTSRHVESPPAVVGWKSTSRHTVQKSGVNGIWKKKFFWYVHIISYHAASLCFVNEIGNMFNI